MRRLKYTGKARQYLFDLPKLSEMYLFKESEGFECNVQDADAEWLLVHRGDILTDAASVYRSDVIPKEIVDGNKRKQLAGASRA